MLGDNGLWASSSNYGQLDTNLVIPIPKFGHPILGITALDLILIVSRLILLETWMEIVRMMLPL